MKIENKLVRIINGNNHFRELTLIKVFFVGDDFVGDDFVEISIGTIYYLDIVGICKYWSKEYSRLISKIINGGKLNMRNIILTDFHYNINYYASNDHERFNICSIKNSIIFNHDIYSTSEFDSEFLNIGKKYHYNSIDINGNKYTGVLTYTIGSEYSYCGYYQILITIGTIVYNNGDVYEGSMRYNMRNGYGKMIYNNGDVYEGEWKENQKYGYGKMIYNNGDVYEGEWNYYFKQKIQHYCRMGKGKLTCTNGNVYEGEWFINVPRSDECKIIIFNKYTYEGNFYWFSIYEVGKVNYINGDVYEGAVMINKNDPISEWKIIKVHEGKMIYADGTIYEGKWKDDIQCL